MKILEVLSEECKAGKHESPDCHGCRGRGRANDSATQVGRYAGEQIRTWCTCICHTAKPAVKTNPSGIPRAVIPPLNLV